MARELVKKINFYLILIIIIFIPFYRFAQGVLSYHTHLGGSATFWAVHFYEPLVILILALNFFVNIKTFFARKFFSSYLLLVFGLILALSHRPFGIGLEGFRFDLFGIFLFILAAWSSLDQSQKRIITNSYIAVALLIALWAILERFLPLFYWGTWGVLNPADTYWYGWHRVVNLTQSVSLVGGPNQLGTYLLPAFFLTLLDRDRRKIIFAVIILLGITFSFSRSAWLGLIVGMIGLIAQLIFNQTNPKKKFGFIAGALLLILVGIILYRILAIHYPDILTHGQSQSQHLDAYQTTFLELKNRLIEPMKFLFGAGLGTAGPLSLKYGQGLVSESWYLQIMLEMGILGLALYLIWFAQQFVLLFERNFALFLSLLAVFIAAAFLHTWSDNPAVTYTLFILIGMTYEGVGKTKAKAIV